MSAEHLGLAYCTTYFISTPLERPEGFFRSENGNFRILGWPWRVAYAFVLSTNSCSNPTQPCKQLNAWFNESWHLKVCETRQLEMPLAAADLVVPVCNVYFGDFWLVTADILVLVLVLVLAPRPQKQPPPPPLVSGFAPDPCIVTNLPKSSPIAAK